MSLLRSFVQRSSPSLSLLQHCKEGKQLCVVPIRNQTTSEKGDKKMTYSTQNMLFIGGAIGAAVAVYYLMHRDGKGKAQAKGFATNKSTPDKIMQDLPSYGYDEVSKHTTKDKGIWVTYKNGVYDITNFAATHPGGSQILEAAGGSVDPFWDLYQQHDTPEVEEMLESLRIGNYKDAGVFEKNNDLWANQPKRDPRLIMRSERPCNAETPKSLLGESYITPNNLFYVRHHLPVPEIDLATYNIEVKSDDSKNAKVLKLSLNDLKKFPKLSVTAALMCAGNRRSQMNEYKPTKGLNWGPGAIGNAVWSGARLKDVLEAAGVKPDENKHVQFVGSDMDATGQYYGSSIPLTTAMNERNDVILAYEMNGKPIPRDHGFPVRAFIPGTVGARCVKWLRGITVSNNESPSHWQQMDYRGFNPSVDPDAEAYRKSTSIQFLPVTSAILYPESGESVTAVDGYVTVRGYAWSGGGQKILRVDLTGDNGKTWINGDLVQQDKNPAGRHWAWTFWTAKIPVVKGQKQMEIWVKAVDSNYNNQPDSVANIWNVRGVLNNSFDKIKFNIK